MQHALGVASYFEVEVVSSKQPWRAETLTAVCEEICLVARQYVTARYTGCIAFFCCIFAMLFVLAVVSAMVRGKY